MPLGRIHLHGDDSEKGFGQPLVDRGQQVHVGRAATPNRSGQQPQQENPHRGQQQREDRHRQYKCQQIRRYQRPFMGGSCQYERKFADLGQGVLDSAMVEVAAYCLRKEGRQ